MISIGGVSPRRMWQAARLPLGGGLLYSALLCFTVLYCRINAVTREAVERRAECADIGVH